MEISRIRFMEHLAINCLLSLQKFCLALQQKLNLPDFEFDFENETEWGLVEQEGIEYNISRPYERGMLKKWGDAVPSDCNFGVSLMVSSECPKEFDINWGSTNLGPNIGQILAELFNNPVYYHRTWLGVGKYLPRNQIFYPKSS